MGEPILYFEAGQSPQGYNALTDSGDNKTFNSAAQLWSKRSGFAPIVRPNGIKSGLVVSVAASGSDDVVDITAGKVFLAGVETDISAVTDQAIVRPAADTHQKFSITINSGGSVAVVDGAEGTSFSDTRGANGGPPWIPTGSIEVAQIQVSAQASAAITADEIKQIVGTHREMFNNPVWDVKPYRESAGVLGYAGVDMVSALPQIHSDDSGTTTAGKKVYVSYATPDFAVVSIAKDFQRPSESYSVNSEQFYGLAVGEVSSTLNAGSFTMRAPSKLADPLLAMEGEDIFFKLFPDRLETPYMLSQGKLGAVEDVKTDGTVEVACAIAAEVAGVRILS